MLDAAPKRHVHGDYDRRWLSDDYFDLIVWYTSTNTVHGFQLCYDKPQWERALTWLSNRGFAHSAVDSGEDTPEANRTLFLSRMVRFPPRKFSPSSRGVVVRCRLTCNTSLRKRSVSLCNERSNQTLERTVDRRMKEVEMLSRLIVEMKTCALVSGRSACSR